LFPLSETGEGGGSGSGTGSGEWRGQQQQHGGGGGIQSAIQQRGMKKSGASSTTNLRRAPIRASAFVVDDHHGGSHTAEGAVKYVLPPVIPKDDASKALIYNAIKDNVLFSRRQKDNTKSSNNDTDELRDLIDAFVIKRCSKNDIIIQEGAQGDGFYVLSSGTVAVYESTAFKGNLYPGTGFGEIALLYSCPRTATVRAREDCDLWFMDRRAFRAIMSRHKRKRLDMKLMLLEKVKIHNKTLKDILKPHEIHSIAMAAKFEEYASGQVIVRQGGVGDAFYMIERGCVDVYIREKSQTSPVVTLKAGDFFGEKALLSSDVRTATCVAAPASRQGGEQQKAAGDGGGEGVVKCMVLMREDFVRMLGDLEYLLERSYEMRDGSERSMMMKTGGPKFQGMDTLVHPMSAM
jgi:CRP-like cAMP-binding protein